MTLLKGYKKYYLQKIGWYLITLVVAVFLNFMLPRLMPGNPVDAIAQGSISPGMDATAVKKVLDDYSARFGLDQPLYVQFFTFVKNALRGDLVTIRERFRTSLHLRWAGRFACSFRRF